VKEIRGGEKKKRGKKFLLSPHFCVWQRGRKGGGGGGKKKKKIARWQVSDENSIGPQQGKHNKKKTQIV